MATTQARATDVRFEFLELITPTGTFDLQKLFVSMNIYEDLF